MWKTAQRETTHNSVGPVNMVCMEYKCNVALHSIPPIIQVSNTSRLNCVWTDLHAVFQFHLTQFDAYRSGLHFSIHDRCFCHNNCCILCVLCSHEEQTSSSFKMCSTRYIEKQSHSNQICSEAVFIKVCIFGDIAEIIITTLSHAVSDVMRQNFNNLSIYQTVYLNLVLSFSAS